MNQLATHKRDGVFSLLEYPQMQVEVILASRAVNAAGDDQGPPVYTIRMRYPRPIHGEIMTHRVFSRNARSSRAVPVKTMLNEVRTMPFIPWHWGKNQKGMQASEECNEFIPIEGLDSLSREEAWAWMAEYSADTAEAFMEAGYHKQIVNRLLEPFSWIDTLITSTEWNNFLWLRDHKDAEPHLQDLARLVKQAIDNADVQILEPGEWHLPYITETDRHMLLVDSGRLAGERYTSTSGVDDHNDWLRRVSAARCARISYKPFDGDASYEKELERYNMLVTSDRVHASPLEHQATPDTKSFASVQYEMKPNQIGHQDWVRNEVWDNPHLHGNLEGWIQARKLVPNEAYRG